MYSICLDLYREKVTRLRYVTTSKIMQSGRLPCKFLQLGGPWLFAANHHRKFTRYKQDMVRYVKQVVERSKLYGNSACKTLEQSAEFKTPTYEFMHAGTTFEQECSTQERNQSIFQMGRTGAQKIALDLLCRQMPFGVRSSW